MQVWKFPLRPGTAEQHIQMPAGGKILSIQLQGGLPMVWVLCNPTAPTVYRKMWAAGTGDDIDECLPFISTLQIGEAVVHYFDLGEQ